MSVLRLYMVIGVTTGRILFYFPLLFNKSSPFYISNIYSASCRVGHMGNYIRNKKRHTSPTHSRSPVPNFPISLSTCSCTLIGEGGPKERMRG